MLYYFIGEIRQTNIMMDIVDSNYTALLEKNVSIYMAYMNASGAFMTGQTGGGN